MSFTKEAVEKKIKNIDEEIHGVQRDIKHHQFEGQRIIEANPEIQEHNRQISQLIGKLNQLNGKKEVFKEILSTFEPNSEPKPPEPDVPS